MLPGCEVAQSLSAEPTPNQDMQDCVLPADWIVKCHGLLEISR
jgi:hypothetical protein